MTARRVGVGGVIRMSSGPCAGAIVSHVHLPSLRAEQTLMGMPHATERWTAERVRALPDDGNRYELVSGELVVTPAPRGVHQEVVMELIRRLQPWLHDHAVGRLLPSPAD